LASHETFTVVCVGGGTSGNESLPPPPQEICINAENTISASSAVNFW
jgi:hypothetical protein